MDYWTSLGERELMWDLWGCTPSCFSPSWGRREKQMWSNGSRWQKKYFTEYHLLQGNMGALGHSWTGRGCRSAMIPEQWNCVPCMFWHGAGLWGALCLPGAVAGTAATVPCDSSLVIKSEINGSAVRMKSLSDWCFPCPTFEFPSPVDGSLSCLRTSGVHAWCPKREGRP